MFSHVLPSFLALLAVLFLLRSLGGYLCLAFGGIYKKWAITRSLPYTIGPLYLTPAQETHSH